MARRKIITSETELLVAVEVFHEIRAELIRLQEQQTELEGEHPWLLTGVDLPEETSGPVKVYGGVTGRIDKLRQDILTFPQAEQMTIMRQEETRQKRGELVLASSVLGAMQEAFIVARKYVPALQRGSLDGDMKLILDRFRQQNPGAILSAAGAQREEEEEMSLEMESVRALREG